MSKWLASVQSLEEAQTLLPVLPDILDMKNPAEGALGALTVEIVSQIVTLIDGRCQTSATIGDLPMQADVIASAMIEMASAGVDYVKIGLFPDDNLTDCILSLAETVKKLKAPVIAVIFVDKAPDNDCLPLLKASGFRGVMVDTAVKNGQHLLEHWDRSAQTKWQVVERKNNQTKIHFYPITGRTHQLRVHSAHIKGLNIPIVGDDLYGNKAERLHLHAETLELTHPITRELMHFQVEAEF